MDPVDAEQIQAQLAQRKPVTDFGPGFPPLPSSRMHTRPDSPPKQTPSTRRDPTPLAQPSAHTAPGTPNMMRPASKPPTPRPRTADTAPTNAPPPAPATPAAVTAVAGGERALNVTDALGYLDAVKNQFHDKPEVYNKFLDIMKDFKSSVIDTPGVIQRVSELFYGHPNLITGFNTFLPYGYRIDPSSDPRDPNLITVTTPSGVTTHSAFPGRTHRIQPREQPGMPAPPMSGLVSSGFAPMRGSVNGGPSSRSMTPHGFPGGAPPGALPVDPAMFSPGIAAAASQQTNAAATMLGNLGNGAQPQMPKEEFQRAIDFLNKIKMRYEGDHHYKLFLEVLQACQKQRFLPQEVLQQVHDLFHDAPELLHEFNDFLPTGLSGVPGGGQTGLVNEDPSWTNPESLSAIADKPQQKKQAPKRKKRPVEKEASPGPAPAKAPPAKANKKPKHRHVPDPASPTFSYATVPSPPPSQAQPSTSQPAYAMQNLQQTILLQDGRTPEGKLMFFDHAKKALESREMYEDFLKTLTLFSKDIFGVKDLIDRAKVFLGDGDLLAEFKELLGYDERRESIEYGPPGSLRMGPPEALLAQPTDDGQGPSYRRLPDSEIYLACSGRDEHCRSLLNDEWVSHPTWASEEAGFVAHKKNSFEEALHKSEEERHEYHVHIEALRRTIAVLDPLYARIEDMTHEERANFKLDADLGGPSKSIYQRIIKKVYGRDSGQEILVSMQETPAVAIPVVLARLKQKDEEWRRLQREYARTWKAVDSANFYRSIDHMGPAFKNNDKKNITQKHFVGEIIDARKAQVKGLEEQISKGKEKAVPVCSRGSIGVQLEYQFEDTAVLQDSLKLVYSFLDHSPGQYNLHERRAIEKFLRAFIPVLCGFNAQEFNAACGPFDAYEDEHEMNGHGEHHGRSGRRSTGSHTSHQGVPPGDLRRRLIRAAQEREEEMNGAAASPSHSRASSPAPSASKAAGQEDEVRLPDVWIRDPTTMNPVDNIAYGADVDRPFFANTTFYLLLRLLQELYARLLTSKQTSRRHAAENFKSLLANPVAVQLGLDEPNGPPALLAQTREALAERGISDERDMMYMYLLDAAEKSFSNDKRTQDKDSLDNATFEEHMRWFFGFKAYQLFTLDKLIAALIKQVQTVVQDHRCQELWSLLQSVQSSERISIQDTIRYRREAELHVSQDDHLYRIRWVRATQTLQVQLMGSDDASVDGNGGTSRWREYVNSYVLRHRTEYAPRDSEGAPRVFLKRSLHEEEAGRVYAETDMAIRVTLPSYKLLYITGTEDVFARRRAAVDAGPLWERAAARQEERRRCRLLV
ncbi:hypothetical protein EV122DRAFT_257431 [Schizophyllum commune]